MRKLVGKRLPKFTPKESKSVKDSFDFLGMNYYTSNFAAPLSTPPNTVNISSLTDNQVNQTSKLLELYIQLSKLKHTFILSFLYSFVYLQNWSYNFSQFSRFDLFFLKNILCFCSFTKWTVDWWSSKFSHSIDTSAYTISQLMVYFQNLAINND